MSIEMAGDRDVDGICSVMESVSREIHDPGVFYADDRQFISDHITSCGFTLKACADGGIVGFLIVRYPGDAEDNLGRDIGLGPEELDSVFHIESVAILPEYRGHGLQRCLVAEGEAIAARDGRRFALATVSPVNRYSLDNMLVLGYSIVTTCPKYGSTRHILRKDLLRKPRHGWLPSRETVIST